MQERIIVITYIELKSLWHFFKVSSHALQINRQLKKEAKLLNYKARGLGRHHYTISEWPDRESMQAFMSSGAHLKAMKETSKLAKSTRFYNYSSTTTPSWKEAKELLKKGRCIQY